MVCHYLVSEEKMNDPKYLKLMEDPDNHVESARHIPMDYESLRERYGDIAWRSQTDLYDRHKGETVFICGSGSSLKECPESLPGPSIAINRAILKVRATYWAFLDMAAYRMAKDHPNALFAEKLVNAGLYTFLSEMPAYSIECEGKPSRHPEGKRPLYWNISTFSFALHLAIRMGAKRVVLIGCEFDTKPYFDGFEFDTVKGQALKAAFQCAHDRMREMFDIDKSEWYERDVEILDASGGNVPVPKVRLEDVLC